MRLQSSLNLHAARFTAMLIAELDDVRRIWGKFWVPRASWDLQFFLAAGLMLPLLFNVYREVSRQCVSQTLCWLVEWQSKSIVVCSDVQASAPEDGPDLGVTLLVSQALTGLVMVGC